MSILALLGGCVNTHPSHLREQRYRVKDCDQRRIDAKAALLPAHPLTLQEIIRIAICNNLDLRVKEQEYAIQQERATGQKLKTLPSWTFSGEDSWRNANTASYSINATTGEISAGVDPVTGLPLPPGSIGSSQRVKRWDLTAAYSIVDFGLSYLRARQEVNRALSTQFTYCRARQNLILDVMKAYWKVMSAKKVLQESIAIRKTAWTLQGYIEENIQAKYIPHSTGIRSELQLVGIRERLAPIEKKYKDAVVELSALMGIPPGTEFDLADVKIDSIEYELEDMDAMEDLALANRPELYASDAEYHIFKDEVKAALVEMFPNASIFAGRNYDADPFLIHHWWTLTGTRVAWNLLSLPQKWFARREAKERLQLSHESRLALSLGILAQVHIAHISHIEAKVAYINAKEISDLNNRLLRIATVEREYGELDGIDMINFDADSIESYHNLLQAYGNIQISLEILNNAMGLPLFYNHLPEAEQAESSWNFEGGEA